ncbi:hypothetical protein LIER_17625 [Lithospermum erythrorhizon]|uniref:RNase H type-1 domain-containing protein n=1 Tax=Lithospermum erythrorhizon TaxID=34254 RepID=A0AAV3QDR5_LITER
MRYKSLTSIKAQALADFMVECTHELDEGAPNQVDAADQRVWLLYIDGASNPGAMNNEAEYEALANGLSLGNDLGEKHIHIRMDSQKRVVGYLRRVRNLTRVFRSCHMEHVPRERNQEADRLSQLATK